VAASGGEGAFKKGSRTRKQVLLSISGTSLSIIFYYLLDYLLSNNISRAVLLAPDSYIVIIFGYARGLSSTGGMGIAADFFCYYSRGGKNRRRKNRRTDDAQDNFLIKCVMFLDFLYSKTIFTPWKVQ
jgi:hypothetical protein